MRPARRTEGDLVTDGFRIFGPTLYHVLSRNYIKLDNCANPLRMMTLNSKHPAASAEVMSSVSLDEDSNGGEKGVSCCRFVLVASFHQSNQTESQFTRPT